MKRDMDLIRKLMLLIEGDELGSYPDKDEQFVVHIGLLEEAGYIKGMNVSNPISGGRVVIQTASKPRLTWEGCEFLDLIRDDGIWKKTKDAISENVGAASVSVMMMLANEYVKQKLGLS